MANENNCKPPLGVCPADLRCSVRIEELADAISRAAAEGSARCYINKITLWAKEILAQVEIIKMSESEDNDGRSCA